MAAKAVAPKNWPTNTPSIVWYRDDASMLTIPGMEVAKNSFSGGVLAKKQVDFMTIPPIAK